MTINVAAIEILRELFLIHPSRLKAKIKTTHNCCNKHIGHGFQPKTVIVKAITARAIVQIIVLIGKSRLPKNFIILIIQAKDFSQLYHILMCFFIVSKYNLLIVNLMFDLEVFPIILTMSKVLIS